MSNVVRFPKKFRDSRADQPKRAGPSELRAVSCRVLLFAWMIVRVPIFLVLYWLRLPVLLVCNFVSIPALGAFLFTWYAFPDKTAMLIGFGVVSFFAFVVLWVYDFVLMILSPQDLVKSL